MNDELLVVSFMIHLSLLLTSLLYDIYSLFLLLIFICPIAGRASTFFLDKKTREKNQDCIPFLTVSSFKIRE